MIYMFNSIDLIFILLNIYAFTEAIKNTNIDRVKWGENKWDIRPKKLK